MRPLREFPLQARRQVRFVLCDIDDTLTDGGRLTARAYNALERLQVAGLKVVPVTGRPAGWCDLIARFWPVAAVVGETAREVRRHLGEVDPDAARGEGTSPAEEARMVAVAS